jgi:large subunit ribosomal protein L17
MRHRSNIVKLQRTASHRKALLKNLCKSLIQHRRIRTTLAKAKAVRPHAEKLVTYGKKALAATGTEQQIASKKIHYIRLAFAKLRDNDLVWKLFYEIAVAAKDRAGGYTRITKLGQRQSDSAPMAFIEWVDSFVPATTGESKEEPAAEEKPVKAKKGKAAAKAEAPEAKPAKKATKKKAAKAD